MAPGHSQAGISGCGVLPCLSPFTAVFSDGLGAVLKRNSWHDKGIISCRQRRFDRRIHPVAGRDRILEARAGDKFHKFCSQFRMFAGSQLAGNFNLHVLAFAEVGRRIIIFFLFNDVISRRGGIAQHKGALALQEQAISLAPAFCDGHGLLGQLLPGLRRFIAVDFLSTHSSRPRPGVLVRGSS